MKTLEDPQLAAFSADQRFRRLKTNRQFGAVAMWLYLWCGDEAASDAFVIKMNVRVEAKLLITVKLWKRCEGGYEVVNPPAPAAEPAPAAIAPDFTPPAPVRETVVVEDEADDDPELDEDEVNAVLESAEEDDDGDDID